MAHSISFKEALCRCAVHGELTEAQAREWLEGEDLELALKVISTPHLHIKWPGWHLLEECHKMLLELNSPMECSCRYTGKCVVCRARALVTDLDAAVGLT